MFRRMIELLRRLLGREPQPSLPAIEVARRIRYGRNVH